MATLRVKSASTATAKQRSKAVTEITGTFIGFYLWYFKSCVNCYDREEAGFAVHADFEKYNKFVVEFVGKHVPRVPKSVIDDQTVGSRDGKVVGSGVYGTVSLFKQSEGCVLEIVKSGVEDRERVFVQKVIRNNPLIEALCHEIYVNDVLTRYMPKDTPAIARLLTVIGDKTHITGFLLEGLEEAFTLMSMLHTLTVKQLRCVFAQVFAFLAEAFAVCSFSHNDLHYQNVLLTPTGDTPVTFTYPVTGLKVKVPAGSYVATVVDFGESYVGTMGLVAGMPYREKPFGYPGNFHVIGNDVFKLINFCSYYCNSDPDNIDVCRELEELRRELTGPLYTASKFVYPEDIVELGNKTRKDSFFTLPGSMGSKDKKFYISAALYTGNGGVVTSVPIKKKRTAFNGKLKAGCAHTPASVVNEMRKISPPGTLV